jgi:hypothetical protein
MVRKILIGVICFVCISCNRKESNYNNEIEVIKINPLEAKEEINLSEFVDSVKYIKLQTDSNCILGRIALLIIKQKYIYVCDVGQMIIFMFDKNGKYVSKLDKRGKGPGEYWQIAGVFIDDDEKFIEVLNINGSLLKYSNISFNLLEKRSIDRVFANSFRKIDDKYYFATQQIKNTFNKKPTNANILIVKNGKIIKTLFDKDINTNNIGYSPFLESFTINDKKELFVSIMYDNTFYKLQDMNAFPVFTVDFGNYGIDNSIGLKSMQEQMQYLRKNTVGKAFFPVLNINNSGIVAFTYCFSEDKDRTVGYEFIKLKRNNKVFHTKRIKNDITDFPSYISLSSSSGQMCHEIWYNDYLVSIVQPANMLTYGNGKNEIKGLGIVTAEDNPIIVLMKLKK